MAAENARHLEKSDGELWPKRYDNNKTNITVQLKKTTKHID